MGKMNRALAEDAFEALETALQLVDRVQGAVEVLQAIVKTKGGLLKLPMAQLRLAIDDAKAVPVAPELLVEYEEVLKECESAQAKLKRQQDLAVQLKEAQESKGE